MKEISVFVVFNIVHEWDAEVISFPSYFFGVKVNNALNTYWSLLLNKLQFAKATSTDFNFGISSQSLSWSTSYFIHCFRR